MFTVHLCELRVDAGKYIAFEHPRTARPGQLTCMKMLADMQGVTRINVDMCMFGMMATDHNRNTVRARKPTTIMTNSMCIVRELIAQGNCDNSHRHAPPIGGRAGACEVYPPEFCRNICRGLKNQLQLDDRARKPKDISNIIKKIIAAVEADDVGTPFG